MNWLPFERFEILECPFLLTGMLDTDKAHPMTFIHMNKHYYVTCIQN